MKRAIFPGSFDPFTLGHLDVVTRASPLFHTVTICPMVNGDKAGKGLFTLKERDDIIYQSVKHLPNVMVKRWDGLLADAIKALDIDVIIKGVRNGTDFDWELQLAQINRGIIPDIDTIFFPSKPEHMHISSTAAREMIRYQQNLEEYLHPCGIKIVQDIVDKRLENA